MLAHLNALKAHLEPLEYATHLVWADEVTDQYLVLTGRGWDDPTELPVCGRSDDLDTEVRIKAVAGTVDGVFIMLRRIRALLSPHLEATRLTVPGRSAWIQFVRSEFVDVDQDSTIAGTSRHPAVGVDSYRLISQPL